MRRSPMKRGKEAGMSDMPTQLRKLGAWLLENDLDMKAPDDTCDPREAADTIEALQQRCEALERKIRVHEGSNRARMDRIAALEGSCGLHHANYKAALKMIGAKEDRIDALEGALTDAIGDLETVAQIHGHSIDLTQYRQALTAREELGECEHGCTDGWVIAAEGETIDSPDARIMWPCPICGTGRQSEGG